MLVFEPSELAPMSLKQYIEARMMLDWLLFKEFWPWYVILLVLIVILLPFTARGQGRDL